MAFERKPFTFEDEQLYSALPLEDRFMGYGAVGHVRAELQWYDFHHMRCPEDKRLATPAFRRELKALLGALRRGVFKSEPALSDFAPTVRPVRIIGDYDISFKVQSEGYSYYVRCHPMARCGHDITIRAYDNALLLPELAGKHKLPGHCFSILPDSGTLVILQQERPYVQSFVSDDPVDVRRLVADDLNEAMGVTKAQEKAMLMGCLHGFDQPCAWPWQYEKAELHEHGKSHQDKGAI
jgi:hypothetical protein